MKYATIQGEPVPALGLGTWQLEGAPCRRAVEHALDLGYRHVDTAQAYQNEEAVGEGIRNAAVDRDQLFLTTKVQYDSLQPDAVRRTTEASLRKLQVEYVDLLLIHWPSEDVPLARTLAAFRALQEEGKTRHIGVSNFTPSLLQEALEHAPIFCNQVEYHPFLGQETLLEMARAHDFMLTAYSPLARGQVLQNHTLREIGEAHGKSPVQVTLRWLIQQAQVAAIPKAASPEHRAGNFDLFDFSLSDDEMDRIFRLDRDERIIDPSFAPTWER